MQEIISKATAILDENMIPPFARMMYQTHLEEALNKIISPDVLKNFKNSRVEPEPKHTFVSFNKKTGLLSVQCRLFRYLKRTGFRTYDDLSANWLIQVNIDGRTTVKYKEKGSNFKTMLTNELHIPCDLKF